MKSFKNHLSSSPSQSIGFLSDLGKTLSGYRGQIFSILAAAGLSLSTPLAKAEDSPSSVRIIQGIQGGQAAAAARSLSAPTPMPEPAPTPTARLVDPIPKPIETGAAPTTTTPVETSPATIARRTSPMTTPHTSPMFDVSTDTEPSITICPEKVKVVEYREKDCNHMPIIIVEAIAIALLALLLLYCNKDKQDTKRKLLERFLQAIREKHDLAAKNQELLYIIEAIQEEFKNSQSLYPSAQTPSIGENRNFYEDRKMLPIFVRQILIDLEKLTKEKISLTAESHGALVEKNEHIKDLAELLGSYKEVINSLCQHYGITITDDVTVNVAELEKKIEGLVRESKKKDNIIHDLHLSHEEALLLLSTLSDRSSETLYDLGIERGKNAYLLSEILNSVGQVRTPEEVAHAQEKIQKSPLPSVHKIRLLAALEQYRKSLVLIPSEQEFIADTDRKLEEAKKKKEKYITLPWGLRVQKAGKEAYMVWKFPRKTEEEIRADFFHRLEQTIIENESHKHERMGQNGQIFIYEKRGNTWILDGDETTEEAIWKLLSLWELWEFKAKSDVYSDMYEDIKKNVPLGTYLVQVKK